MMIASTTTFGFQTDGGHSIYQSITGLEFGCSYNTHMNYDNRKAIGILGMNGGPESFAFQLNGIGGGRFSYCLVPLGSEGHAGYLRFGSDMRGAVQRTAMTIARNYYLTLINISLGNKRMGLDLRVFERQAGTGKGGVIIDTGSAMGYMVTAAFMRVRLELLEYMKGHKLNSLKISLT